MRAAAPRGRAEGLATAGAFDAASPPKAVVNALLVASQLARTAAPGSGDGAACEKALKRATLERYLPRLLRSEDAQTRAKACNLVGNLCRHSAAFYPALVEARHGEESALACVIRCASDDDGATRKFACFALGNAAFHSSDLYGALEPGAPPLCACLANDSDEKARANAAGALGNLHGTAGPGAGRQAGALRCWSPRGGTPRPVHYGCAVFFGHIGSLEPCAASSRLSRSALSARGRDKWGSTQRRRARRCRWQAPASTRTREKWF